MAKWTLIYVNSITDLAHRTESVKMLGAGHKKDYSIMENTLKALYEIPQQDGKER